ncbi:MAG: MBL fold metallo-hydrolase [Candidatus Hydrogenedentota bacterium]|nr:MAG: MBL fold metallo-hydrolase [Candidatus Hydrogenedentota bacterium]
MRAMRTIVLGAAILAVISTAQADNFTFPQGVYNGEDVKLTRYPNGGIVNAALLDRLNMTQPVEPYTIEVADGVWALVGYHWGYKAVIEGERGLIIYDTGDDIEECLEILELIKKKISDKPIHTVIYSHAHYGFGTKAITDAYGDDIKIIGHHELNRNLLESGGLGSAIPELAPSLLARTLEQFSILLPDSGPDGKAPTPLGKTKGFVPVNTPVKHGQKMTVDGVGMVFYTDYDSDTDDQVIVYLPETKTVLNNHLWPTFPNFYTLRGSVYRDPTDWADGIKLIRDLEPEHLINTHAIPISGKEKIRQVLSGYYDAIMYLYDQTIRGILLGKTPDELRYWVQLPKDLAEQPNNQMSYGEFSYYPPYIYQYAIGWFGRDSENLNRIAPREQAKKIVKGFGGVDAVKAELEQTLKNQEYAWSAELAGYLVKAAPDDPQARQLLADALRQMGYNTEASIPRSWYLTKALALEGKLQIPTVMFTGPDSVLESKPETFVDQYRVRLDPKVSYGKEQLLAITLDGTDAPTMGLHVRSGVAEFVPDVSKHFRDSDISINMSMKAWAAYFVGDITLDALLESKDIKASNKGKVKDFFSLFDQVHPSKAALIPASDLKKMIKKADITGEQRSFENFILTDAPFPVIDDD